MVNCDGPAEQKCCLKCPYVSFAEAFLFSHTNNLHIVSHRKPPDFLAQCLTKAHRKATHERVAYETSE